MIPTRKPSLLDVLVLIFAVGRHTLATVTTNNPLEACASDLSDGRTMASPKVVDVVVVGAGISGLVAAEALVAKKLTVVVVESRPRIGGRLVPSFPSASPLDRSLLCHSTALSSATGCNLCDAMPHSLTGAWLRPGFVNHFSLRRGNKQIVAYFGAMLIETFQRTGC
jgi:hypothetical protein